MVGIQLSLDGLDSVIYHPFAEKEQITAQRLLDLLEKVVQSNAKVTLKNIEVKVVQVNLPKGGGMGGPRRFAHNSLHSLLKRKQSIVSVRGDDELCFGRCLALGICAHTSDQKDFKKFIELSRKTNIRSKKAIFKSKGTTRECGDKRISEILAFADGISDYCLRKQFCHL